MDTKNKVEVICGSGERVGAEHLSAFALSLLTAGNGTITELPKNEPLQLGREVSVDSVLTLQQLATAK